MRALFVDTGAFLAKELASDQHHAEAARGWGFLGEGMQRLMSSEHVFDESVTLLARRTNYAWASEWGNDAMASGIKWLRAGDSEWRTALRFMRKYADQGVSFTDCLSFALMKREGIRQVFAFDRHFEMAGLRLWAPSRRSGR